MSLKKNLKRQCTFLDTFSDKNENGRPKKEISYLRCDYSGNRWYNTVWPINIENKTQELIKEFDFVYNEFKKEFVNLDVVSEFCFNNAENIGYDEYNMFLEGEYGNYWFRFILRKGDHNLYLHAYTK